VELTPKIEYALLALMELADNHGQSKAMKMNEITAKHPSIPERYLEQILLMLRRKGLIQSQRGAKGGYVLARDPWQITLLEIIRVFSNKPEQQEAPKTLTIEQSAIHHLWVQSCQATESVFSDQTLQDLCQAREQYRESVPMYYI
jgi:Rrf2 family protein